VSDKSRKERHQVLVVVQVIYVNLHSYVTTWGGKKSHLIR